MALVVLCDHDVEFLGQLETVVSGLSDVQTSHHTASTEAVAEAIARDAHVVVFGPSIDRDAALSSGELLAAKAPHTSVVLVVRTVDQDLLRVAMRAGFHDVVAVEGVTYGDIAASIDDARTAASRQRESAGADGRTPGQVGKVVTVFSTKGGVGKSVIAINVAAVLAANFGKRVALLDLDLESGDDAVMLGIEPTRTIYDAVRSFDRLDAQLLRGFMHEHRSGARVLLAPIRPEHAEAISAARIAGIIELAREDADFVVIDTPGRLDEVVITAIDKSDQVLTIATMDLPSIKNTKVSLQKLRQLGYQNGLVKLVLNRADSKVFLESAEVEQAIGGSIFVRIPSDRLVPRSVNRGLPVAIDQPKSAVGKSLIDLARLVARD